MLSTKRLEVMMELEEKLKAEYQVQIDAKDAEIERITKENDDHKAAIGEQLEQQNRELHQRCENLKEELEKQRQRTKSLQKDLDSERAALAELKRLDPDKMKKNLDASKKKLAERTVSIELLQKNLKKTKTENAELQGTVKTLEGKVAELEVA